MISESIPSKIAIEIDRETYHNPSKVSENKYADDLLKQKFSDEQKKLLTSILKAKSFLQR